MVLQVKFLSADFSYCHVLYTLENNCTVVHILSKYTEIPNVFSVTLTGWCDILSFLCPQQHIHTEWRWHWLVMVMKCYAMGAQWKIPPHHTISNSMRQQGKVLIAWLCSLISETYTMVWLSMASNQMTKVMESQWISMYRCVSYWHQHSVNSNFQIAAVFCVYTLHNISNKFHVRSVCLSVCVDWVS